MAHVNEAGRRGGSRAAQSVEFVANIEYHQLPFVAAAEEGTGFEVLETFDFVYPNGLIGATAANAVIVNTGIAMGAVAVRLELWNNAPEPELAAWQDVAEVSVDVDEPNLYPFPFDGFEPDDLAPSLQLAPGSYRVRCSVNGRDTEPDGASFEVCEHYLVQLWPAPPTPPAALQVDSAWGWQQMSDDGVGPDDGTGPEEDAGPDGGASVGVAALVRGAHHIPGYGTHWPPSAAAQSAREEQAALRRERSSNGPVTFETGIVEHFLPFAMLDDWGMGVQDLDSFGFDVPNRLVTATPANGFVVEGGAQGANASVTMEILDEAPPLADGWQDIAETTLHATAPWLTPVSFGSVEIDGEPVEFWLEPGEWRVRCHATGRDSTPDDYSNDVHEHYLIQLWPTSNAGPDRVLALRSDYSSRPPSWQPMALQQMRQPGYQWQWPEAYRRLEAATRWATGIDVTSLAVIARVDGNRLPFLSLDRDLSDYQVLDTLPSEVPNGLVAANDEVFVLATGIGRGNVEVTYEWLDHEPAPAGSQWEDVVEVPWRAAGVWLQSQPSGGWRGDVGEAIIAMRPGECRLRCCASGRDAAAAGGRKDVIERHLVQLWPAPFAPERVVRMGSAIGR